MKRIIAVGFTIIELLVVMAIIAILAAITLPALNGARNRSYEADCQNNLGQMGKALVNYCTTENKNTPDADSTSDNVLYGGQNVRFMKTLNDYGIETNSPAWFCKRQLRFIGKTQAELTRTTPRSGYFYWAWRGSSVLGIDVLTFTSNCAWVTKGWSGLTATSGVNKLPGTPWVSCAFYDISKKSTFPSEVTAKLNKSSVQFHSGSDFEMSMTDAGTPVLVTGGAVKKVPPK